MHLTPRQSFLASNHKRFFHDAVATDWFHSAIETSLVMMQYELKGPPDMATAASHAWRMEGAKQFIKILMDLTETEKKAPPKVEQNLDHTLT